MCVLSDHYFSENPQSKSKPKTWNYTLRERNFIFTTDVGVFSKNEVDFGSRLLIESFQMPEVAGEVLDLGCGYGPVGISLGSVFPEREIISVDINERALALAEANAKANQVQNIQFIHSNGLENLQERKFAAVLTNPPIRAGKIVVHRMFAESYEALVTGGELWIVIQKKQGAPSAKAKLADLFGNVEMISRSKGYFIYKAKKV